MADYRQKTLLYDHFIEARANNDLYLIKNTNLEICEITRALSRLLGWQKEQDAVGKRNVDIPNCLLGKLHDVDYFEQEVFGHKIAMHVLVLPKSDEYPCCFTYVISPIMDGKKVIGLHYKLNYDSDNFFEKHIFEYFDKIFTKNTETKCFILNLEDFLPFKLTARETDILFYIINFCMSAKRISFILGLSHRTTECYIHNILNEANCQSKEELINKFRLEYIVPYSLFSPDIKSLEKLYDSKNVNIQDIEGNKVKLTKRQMEVLRFANLGNPNKEIARYLHILPETVNKHAENIRNKTGFGSIARTLKSFRNWLEFD